MLSSFFYSLYINVIKCNRYYWDEWYWIFEVFLSFFHTMRPYSPEWRLRLLSFFFVFLLWVLLGERIQAAALLPPPPTPDHNQVQRWSWTWFYCWTIKGWKQKPASIRPLVWVFKSFYCIFPELCKLCVDIINKCRPAAISTLHTNENHGKNFYYCTPNLFTINS